MLRVLVIEFEPLSVLHEGDKNKKELFIEKVGKELFLHSNVSCKRKGRVHKNTALFIPGKE